MGDAHDIDDLRAELKQLRHVVSRIPAVMYTYDVRTHRLNLLNDELENMLGYTRDEVSKFDQLVQNLAPEELPRLSQIFSKWEGKAEPGETKVSVVRARHKDGRTRVLQSVGRCAERDADGRVLVVAGTLSDITQQTELTEQVQRLEKLDAIGRLAGGVAHDFNNVLTAIMGSAELALLQPNVPTASQDYLHEVIRSAERGAELTQSLLSFACKPELRLRPESVGLFLPKVERLLARIVGPEHAIDYRVQTSPWVVIDPPQLLQILQNLVVNARDAMPQGGKIEVVVSEVRQYGRRWARIDVRDSGVGMDETTTERVFEPFFTTKANGHGLGLPTVHTILHQLGGHLEIESSPGFGSVFSVFLPAFEDQAAASTAAHA
jgi:PAS domain S-box-containing protein